MTQDLVEVLRSRTDSDDPVERIGQACGGPRPGGAAQTGRRAGGRRLDHRETLDVQGPSRPPLRTHRARTCPVDRQVRPRATRGRGTTGPRSRPRISAESLFALIDLCGLPHEDAIASLVTTARQMTAAAVAAIPTRAATG
ncbi:hypothetical protein ACRAWF_31200 [Streptomyces sp. L7]